MEYFAEITALAALAVVAVQTILKLNVIPLYFANKYPLVTNVLLSIIASVVVTWQTTVDLVSIWQWVAYTGTIVVLSAMTYNMTIRNSAAVQNATNKPEQSKQLRRSRCSVGFFLLYVESFFKLLPFTESL